MGQFSKGGCLTLIAVADTHAVIWYIFGDQRLSVAARDAFEGAAIAGDYVGFSTMTLAEIVYLTERDRVPKGTLDLLLNTVDRGDTVLLELPFDRHIAEALRRVDRSQVPDLPDRIIAATALQMGVPLISRDRKIRVSGLETLW
ncbi:MAG: type II toxin-antitoxin system VapC family toxin [Chloroflexi bacterium]|nr:type II toxin-antitoxin system VapC family toxin [Chloroflexota bacterium]